MPYYYTDSSNQPVGPVSLDELAELRRVGRIGDDTPVIEEGAADWQACRDFVSPGLLPWTPPSPPAPTRIVLGLHPQRLSIVVAAALGMLTIFLPWYYLPVIGAVLGTHDESWWIVVALFIPALLLAFSGEKRGLLPIKKGLVAAVPAALAACLAISAIHDLHAKRASFDDQSTLAEAVASTVQVGVGPYLWLAAGACLVLIAGGVPLYWRTPRETFVRWCIAAATIVGTALFVRLQLDHGLLIGVALGTVIVGVASLLVSALKVGGDRWRSKWPAFLAACVAGLLGVVLLGQFLSRGQTLVQSAPSATASNAQPVDSWHYVPYKGKHADYQLGVPSFLREMQPPSDRAADRAFVGPGGMVISIQVIPDTNQFWDELTTSKGMRGQTSSEPETHQDKVRGAVTTQGFEITADAVGGLQLVGLCTVLRRDLTYALLVSVPERWPRGARLGAAWVAGQMLGSGARLEAGGDISGAHSYAEGGLFEELANAGLLPGYHLPAATGPQVQSQRPTRAQWKNKVTQNFGWLPGVPVTAQASRFQQVMGKPDDTQTLGDQTLWYYRCADGTVQLAMSALNLQTAGYMQAELNDY